MKKRAIFIIARFAFTGFVDIGKFALLIA